MMDDVRGPRTPMEDKNSEMFGVNLSKRVETVFIISVLNDIVTYSESCLM